ncbi:MAG: hypothetical protein EXS16_10980 [Gemmataceae bacterium]|nr:hypothetical protein [Gemmataceae bacterium]
MVMFVIALVTALGVLGGYWYTLGQLDPMQPDEVFELQFGRGSGWLGLDVLRIVSKSEASYEYRVDGGDWHRKKFKLNDAEMASLRNAITQMNVWAMERAYSRPERADGTQWVLLVRENGKSRSVYFDNNFPEAIRNFAEFVDQKIIVPYADTLNPTVVPERHHLKHQKAIWESIR